MMTLEHRTKTALVVIDMQNGVVANAYDRDAVVANIGRIVGRARREHVPIVWIRHSDDGLAKDTDEWQIVAELRPSDADPVVEKHYGDAFEETGLEDVLSRLEIRRLVVVGAQTDACVRSTIHGAFVRGYDVTLVADAHTTEDQTAWGAPPPALVIAHTNLYWNEQRAPRRTAQVVPTSGLAFEPTR